MCGIGGIFSVRDTRASIKRLTDAIHHRGPDDVGIAELRNAAGDIRGSFGHRRLAIIDLSPAGHQPMFTADSRLCITYNGEIYNYSELRDELAREGVQFHSTCDTEVLLLGWRLHGIAFLQRLRGMYAFAIWDSDRDVGVIARDPFGIKPLYYAESNGEVIFASEVRAIAATERISPQLSRDAVASYLAAGSVAEPLTILDGVYALPPGCIATVDMRSGSAVMSPPERFTSAYPGAEDIDRDPRSHVHRVRNVLRESVRYHLVSDVPVAVFLSGGIDSSTVAGLASEVSEKRLESFTITFDEADFSEAAPAREAAKRFNTIHHEVPLSGRDLLNALPDVFAAMDQPSLDGLNTFVVSRAVRSFGMKVVLSGLGGDELFAGYPSFHRARAISPLFRLPPSMRQVTALGSRSFSDLRAEKISMLLGEESPSRAAYVASRTLFGRRHLKALMSRNGSFTSRADISPDDVDVSALTLLQQVSLYELTGYMRNTLLRDSDVFSMAHALELRVPLVDIEVARAAASAAKAWRFSRGQKKPILVEAVRDLLAPETLAQPKRGFTLPFETWLRNELRDEVDPVLTETDARSVGLDGKAVADVWQQFERRRPGVNWSRPWALYTLLRWAAENGLIDLPRSRVPSAGSTTLSATG